ncbi:Acg family FMN-binding oxidoreductase [Nocardia noduli]|uniref:Acg family FMN-binding oxidoreductase n=1 Tax=Nocardia noduli TaxID=2815722 RepID=UPI0020B4589A|nr:NAD(P)H nitroreductase [Nocardia noduli]
MNAPTGEVIEKSVLLAGRAPSLHNSQPWRWIFDSHELRLYSVSSRILPATDAAGRQLLISCGVGLGHLHAAMAAAGWRTVIRRFPNPNQRDYLAAVEFRPALIVTDADRERADAIVARHTDRLPFAEPTDWEDFEIVLRSTLDPEGASLDVLPADSRPDLARASKLSAALRRYDSGYQAELRWWSGHPVEAAGVPPEVLTSQEDYERVGINRKFPSGSDGPRDADDTGPDRAAVLVLSTDDDSPEALLRCGEALSTVLLECTIAGYATCPLTHLTELPRSRDIVRQLTGRGQRPQVLVRVGMAPEARTDPPATPRLALDDILEHSRRDDSVRSSDFQTGPHRWG